eukprot:CAMPEP_0197614028 /NCGR_PEP_ID=MMETSP1326-20131121/59317_1 /TAXON_ID=1155430 /ORGANISM="Genus nov. species nov., Strain RCC2288" /LENGTH=569 /DNA_ID=CAMNT_0043182897 /DNA_START=226 /DNA_END=1935 /DNA_ORIENTATION=+
MSFLAAMKTAAPPPVEEAAVKVGGATVTKAVIDTNAIVKGFRLERFAEEAVTIPEVLTEVKDKQARHTLATLPFELKVLEPDAEAVAAVRRFARLTGDLPALSEPDIKVVALAYMLERDTHGVAHLRSEPPPLVLSKHKFNKSSKQPGWDFVPNADDWAELDAMNEESENAAEAAAGLLAGASLNDGPAAPPLKEAQAKHEQKQQHQQQQQQQQQQRSKGGSSGGSGGDGDGGDGAPHEHQQHLEQEEGDAGDWEQNVSRTTKIRRLKRVERTKAAEEADRLEREREAADAAAGAEKKAELDASADKAAAYFKAAPGVVPEGAEDEDAEDDEGGESSKGKGKEEEEEGQEEEGEEDDEDDDEGEEEEEDSEGEEGEEDGEGFKSTVCIVTADYAMQNVILQMNMRLITPDGMRITNLRRWVLRCHACGDITRQVTRVFCAKCGNSTLQKVEHTVSADGVEQFGVRRKHVLRGTRFSLPLPKGGRKDKQPILREDQLIGMRRPRKKDDVDVFVPEYNQGSFASGGGGDLRGMGAAHLYRQTELLDVHSANNPGKKNPNERRFVRTNRRRK